ncbi:TetR family transcriptional regulator C-terminal domain-containing protein [Shewanella frigidimarina]|uniref:TetR family transcriptional regulator C-terminal domain-containing protein n=1 Tax=Shewanella frigidimarina TaxID=56812 RepID=UPI003FA10818
MAEHYFQQRIQPIAIDPGVNFKANLSTVLNGYHQLIEELFSGSEPRGCLMGNLMVEVSSQSPLLHQTLNQLYDQWIVLLSALIQQGQQQGHIRADLPASTLASVFWSNWQGTMLRCQIKVDKMAAKRALVQCMQMMTR